MTKQENDIKRIILDALQPGTDKGSSQAIINVKDIDIAAQEIAKRYEPIGHLRQKALEEIFNNKNK